MYSYFICSKKQIPGFFLDTPCDSRFNGDGNNCFFINFFQNRKYKRDEEIYKAYGIEKIKKFETNVIFLKEKFENYVDKEKEINIILNEFYEPEGLELEHKEMLKELKKIKEIS